MSTPTAEQTVRAGANRIARDGDQASAAAFLIGEAVERVGVAEVVRLATGGLLGAKDVGERLTVKVPNLKHVRGLEPIDRVSDGRPVYAAVEVDEVRQVREAAKP